MARPRLGDSDSKRLQMVITEDELMAIDKWQHANHVASRSEAIRRLIQIGLRFEGALGSIDEAAGGLAQATDALISRFYLKPDRAPDLSDEARNAMRAMRKVMRRAQALVEATASVEIQRDHLADAAVTIENALKAADETMRLFSGPYPSQKDVKE